jgi:hypothetical protein
LDVEVKERLDLTDNGHRAMIASVQTRDRQVQRSDQLEDFEAQAAARWEALIAAFPVGSPATFPHAYYDLSMALVGDFDIDPLRI